MTKFMMKTGLSILSFCLTTSALAEGLLVDRTRIIFPIESKKISVEIYNTNETPVLAQLWIDNGNTNSDLSKTHLPVVIYPPVLKLNAGEKRFVTLHISNKKIFPKDKESLLWFNAQEIKPQTEQRDENKNYIDISIVNRLKIFLRPPQLAKLDASHWIQKLACKIETTKKQVVCSNPSPFFATIVSLQLQQNKQTETLTGQMLSPHEKVQFNYQQALSHIDNQTLKITVINDNGYAETITPHPLR